MIGLIISAAYHFHFMVLGGKVIDRHGPCNGMHRQLQPRKTELGFINPLYNSKRHFTRPSSPTKQSILVLKVGVSYVGTVCSEKIDFRRPVVPVTYIGTALHIRERSPICILYSMKS